MPTLLSGWNGLQLTMLHKQLRYGKIDDIHIRMHSLPKLLTDFPRIGKPEKFRNEITIRCDIKEAMSHIPFFIIIKLFFGIDAPANTLEHHADLIAKLSALCARHAQFFPSLYYLFIKINLYYLILMWGSRRHVSSHGCQYCIPSK